MTDKDLGNFLTAALNKAAQEDDQYIIELDDRAFGEGRIYLARFPDGGWGTTPKREDAFVCTEKAADEYYVGFAQKMYDDMEITSCGTLKYTRTARKAKK